MSFSVRKVHPDSIIPTRHHEGDAGVDLYALWSVTIHPWSQGVIDTGIELVELPQMDDPQYGGSNVPLCKGWRSVLQIWPKSGLDAKMSLHTGAGIVDYLYRGEIKVLVKNQSDRIVEIRKGDAIAQAVVVPCYVGDVVEVTATNETKRGKSGGITKAYADRTEE